MSDFVFSAKPIRIATGEGATLYDEAGTAYLDAGASYGCAPIGHNHPAVVEAIHDQVDELLYVHGTYPNSTRDALYDALVSVAPHGLDNIWLCNSGTEANEAALKFARSATGRSKIVATEGAFHGRTMGALATTWKPKYRVPFEPLIGDVTFVPYGDADALATAVDEETAAVILEPILGEGGIHPAPSGYLERAREMTEAAGTALILDEIQTGLGRTGRFWACDHAGVVPDILTSAKGIASGLPLGATLCAEWIAEGAGSHGSTFAGGPVIAAAATATIEVLIEEDLAARAASLGEQLIDGLSDIDHGIEAIRGRGLLVGIDVDGSAGLAARDLAFDEHVLTMTAGRSVVRLLPPLTIGSDEVDQLCDAVGSVLATAEVAS